MAQFSLYFKRRARGEVPRIHFQLFGTQQQCNGADQIFDQGAIARRIKSVRSRGKRVNGGVTGHDGREDVEWYGGVR